MDANKPLISIVVITYNSSESIFETLESSKNQSYPNIELIISDDCSPDNTIEKCNEWLKINKNRFVRSEIISTPINTGVSANLNRGIRASSGRWVKPIAGDDALVFNAIDEFYNFAVASNCSICISRLLTFGANSELLNKIKIDYDQHFEKLLEPQQEQLNRICKELFVPGPGVFFTRNIYNGVNGFDENYPFCEEWPFFYNILNKGYHLRLLDKELVRYRVSEESLCRSGNKADKRVLDSVKAYFFEKRLRQMLKRGMIFQAAKQTVYYHFIDESYKTSGHSFSYRLFKKFKTFLNFFRSKSI